MYIVIKDTSPSHELAQYTDINGNFYIIRTITGNPPTVSGTTVVTADISMYTLLPTVASQQAAALQKTKDNAITKLTNQLETTLSAGVVISNDSLKLSVKSKEKSAKTTSSIILNGNSSNLITLTQGLALINAAAALSTDPIAFANTQVSVIFGRPVVDAQGNVIELTVSQYQQLMLALGGIVGGKQGTLTTTVARINAATTVAEIKAIVNGN